MHQNSQSNKTGAGLINIGNSSPQKGSNAHASFSNVYVGQALAASQQRYRENEMAIDASPHHKPRSKKEINQSSASNIFNQQLDPISQEILEKAYLQQKLFQNLSINGDLKEIEQLGD